MLSFYRAAGDPIRRSVQGAKNAMKYIGHLFTLSNIKHQIGVMQTMSVPELIMGFFMTIFYAFYYSGYGVWAIIRYLLIDVLMSLMRGPAEEVIEEPPVEEERFGMKALTATSVEETSSSMQAFGLDISKEENGQLKVAPHEFAQSSSASDETGGESTSEEGSGEQGDGTGEVEQPMTLVRFSLITLIP